MLSGGGAAVGPALHDRPEGLEEIAAVAGAFDAAVGKSKELASDVEVSQARHPQNAGRVHAKSDIASLLPRTFSLLRAVSLLDLAGQRPGDSAPAGLWGFAVWSKGSAPVRLVDLAAFGRPVRLVWHKWRWRCPAASCAVGSFTEVAEQIAPARSALTARAGRWATMAVGRDARPVADVAAELGCDWHTVMRAVVAWGQALLAADCDRVGAVEALGLDETLFGRQGRWRTRRWCTSIVDVTGGQLLDIVPGRDAQAPINWLLDQPEAWRQSIDWGVLDLSGAYRRTFDVALPHVGQVADPFHVIRLANNALCPVLPAEMSCTSRVTIRRRRLVSRAQTEISLVMARRRPPDARPRSATVDDGMR